MIMVYVMGEELERCLRELGCTQKEVLQIFQQFMSVVHFHHQRHISTGISN